MRPAYQIDVEISGEFLDDVLAEGVADAALVLSPPFYVGIGVRPQEIAEQSLIGELYGSFDAGDIRQIIEIGRQSAVHADDLLIDDRADGHHVEDICKIFPDLEVVPAFACLRGDLH